MFIQIQEKILKVLNLSYNCDREEQKLEKIPTEIFDLKQLEYMELWDNPLPKNLSREIGFEDIRKYFDSLR
ncbi:hypothetical protein H6G11_09940 [Cyanobacterium aponinum FACHB-4101]|uniref:hypothetical protein n=1 Tax=Cyanobacterium aponinum TaxID=379064 RepID=UPI00167FEB5F|nr:hypothetical protein [Cyanobacterium aponinum]MBD2394571.1 hypothetical protein [Cyanobacterium aponinum FACHB-4101]